jgi:hypothetical protein
VGFSLSPGHEQSKSEFRSGHLDLGVGETFPILRFIEERLYESILHYYDEKPKAGQLYKKRGLFWLTILVQV